MVWEFIRELLAGYVRMRDPGAEIRITDRLADWNLDDDDCEGIAGILGAHFGVELTEEEVAGWDTVEDIVESVGDKL